MKRGPPVFTAWSAKVALLPYRANHFFKYFSFFAHNSTYVEPNRTKYISFKRTWKDKSNELSFVKIEPRVVRQLSSKLALLPYHAKHFLTYCSFFVHISTYVDPNRTKYISFKRARKDESNKPSFVKIGQRVVRQKSSKVALLPCHAKHFLTYCSFFAQISTYVDPNRT